MASPAQSSDSSPVQSTDFKQDKDSLNTLEKSDREPQTPLLRPHHPVPVSLRPRHHPVPVSLRPPVPLHPDYRSPPVPSQPPRRQSTPTRPPHVRQSTPTRPPHVVVHVSPDYRSSPPVPSQPPQRKRQRTPSTPTTLVHSQPPPDYRSLILKQQRFKDYKEALKIGEVLVAYTRVMMIGPGGVGKSSFLRGLMNLKLPKNAESTILADTKIVKQQFWAQAGESADSFWAEVTEQDEIQELSGLLQLVALAKLGALIPPHAVAIHSTMEDASAQRGFYPVGFKPQSIRSIRDEYVSHIEDSVVRDVLMQVVESAPTNPVVTQSQVLMHVWDCGGQTVFLDVLPAFLTSRTVFLLFYDARQDLLNKCSMLSYKEGRVLSKSEQSFTTIQLLTQWMASIHAMCTRKGTTAIFTAPSESESPAKQRGEKYTPSFATHHPSHQMQAQLPREDDTLSTIPKFPRIIPVGTHGDDPKVQSKREEHFSTLKSHCDDKAYTPLLMDCVIVNNTTAGCGRQVEDKGFNYVRKTVHQLASKQLAVRTPVAWVLFRRVLQKVAQGSPIVAYQQAVEVGQACGIAADVVPSVLHFYHELAVFLHYTQIESLSQWIIIDPQWLIKQLGKLLAPEGFRQEIPNQSLWKPLQEKGILVQQLYEEVWKESELPPESLVDLLKDFLLAAPINPPKTISPFSGQKYFIPCVLQHSSQNANITANTQEKPPKMSSPLHLIFSTQYVPPGFFTRLATALTREPKCRPLFERGVFRDKMTFAYGDGKVDKIDEFTILELPSSVQISVVRTQHRQLHIPTFRNMCHSILKLVQACSATIYRWLPSVNVEVAFFCEHCRAEECPVKTHFIPIPPDSTTDSVLHCQADQTCSPRKEQQYWLKIRQTTEYLAQKGGLNATELQRVAEDIQKGGKIIDLADALEVVPLLESLEEDPNAASTLLWRWQSSVDSSLQAHSLLVYHLGCIGLVKTSNKLLYREFLPHTDPISAANPSAHCPRMDHKIKPGSSTSEEPKCYQNPTADVSTEQQDAHYNLVKHPTLPQLLNTRYVKIVTEIGAKYETFGVLLLNDQTGAKITAIEQKRLNDAEKINIDILKEWLQGKGKKPVTWQTLVDVLKDIGLFVLAKDIEASLSQIIA